jgi:hypothetical protein
MAMHERKWTSIVKPAVAGPARLDSSTSWCVAPVNAPESQQSYSYSGDRGLQRGVC